MNWVDLVIIITLFYFTLEGIGRSVVLEIFDFFSFFIALVLSLRFYNVVTILLENNFTLPHSLSNVLGFIFLWFLVEIILLIFSGMFFKQIKKFIPLKLDKLLGIVPAFLKGIIFVAIFLVLVATFPVQPKIKKDVNQSKIGSYILSKTYRLESPLKGVFGGLTNDTLTFLTVKPKTSETVDIGFKNRQYFFDEKMEMAMIELVNKERASMGFKALVFDRKLGQVARVHSADMFTRGYFSHYSPEGDSVADRAQKEDIDFLVIGENLAYAPSLDLAHQGLINSQGHRANILSLDFGHIGVGVANSDEYGIMFTQVFSN